MSKKYFYLLFLIITLILVESCNPSYRFRYNYQNANKLLYESNNLEEKPFLKAHFRNGDVFIFNDNWTVDTVGNTVSGDGILYDFNRRIKTIGDYTFSIDSVALFETNTNLDEPQNHRLKKLAILTGINIALGVYCTAIPKACFGSCPTFYVDPNHNFHYADAEGFSNAILPSMEYGDIDALGITELTKNDFYITMKNEALETHCVRAVNILAYPRLKGQRVFHANNDDFYLCENIHKISSASVNNEDISIKLKKPDYIEYISLSDEDNMKSKEEIIISFKDITNPKNLGLILHFRQSLMTTYLLYSAYDYMGYRIGEFLTRMETGKSMKNNFGYFREVLGEIDIYVWDKKAEEWIFQNSFYETGPIAINKQFIPLKIDEEESELTVKIIQNKGMWRIDYLALTNIIDKVKPYELQPVQVNKNGSICSRSLEIINNVDKHLLSLPGNQFEFKYELPKKNTDYELFLYSEGYYLSWMHSEWQKETDLLRLRQMLSNPERYLKRQAADFKKYESQMEEVFWGTRINEEVITNY